MKNVRALSGTLDTIRQDTKGDEIDLEELLKALNSRGYGPLLVGPALITILPTGAIPGVPSMCALLIIFVSIQILFGRTYPWIPSRLKSLSFSREAFLQALDKIKPYTEKIDTYIYPRFKFLIQDIFKPFVIFISIALSIAIMVLGFIPFLAILPATGILLLGVGMTAKDGLLFLLSLAICIISICTIPHAISHILG